MSKKRRDTGFTTDDALKEAGLEITADEVYGTNFTFFPNNPYSIEVTGVFLGVTYTGEYGTLYLDVSNKTFRNEEIKRIEYELESGVFKLITIDEYKVIQRHQGNLRINGDADELLEQLEKTHPRTTAPLNTFAPMKNRVHSQV